MDFLPFVKAVASIPQFPSVFLSTVAYCGNILYLLSPARKEAAVAESCCPCLWAFGLCLGGFLRSCSMPSSLEQKVLQVPSEQRAGWLPSPTWGLNSFLLLFLFQTFLFRFLTLVSPGCSYHTNCYLQRDSQPPLYLHANICLCFV